MNGSVVEWHKTGTYCNESQGAIDSVQKFSPTFSARFNTVIMNHLPVKSDNDGGEGADERFLNPNADRVEAQAETNVCVVFIGCQNASCSLDKK